MEHTALVLIMAFMGVLVFTGLLRWPEVLSSSGRDEPVRSEVVRASLRAAGRSAGQAEALARAAEEEVANAERAGDAEAVQVAETRAAEAAKAAQKAEEAAVAAAKLAAAPTTTTKRKKELSDKPHKMIQQIIKMYSYQPVRTETGALTNIILVRAPMRSMSERALFEKYKNEILFLGICSFEDYPLVPPNPFSGKFPADEYVGKFPGWLHMFRDPENIFPSHVKTLLMSQSDFSLPGPSRTVEKKYDFVYSGSDQDVHADCVGWSSFAKNWTFAKSALEVMCGELGMTGVLIATKDKSGKKACTIPKVCDGKIVQTKYIDQDEFFGYARQSRFGFLPQVHDASPRVSTQFLSLGLPLLMNYNILGGWKYVVPGQTGEFFHDMSDFREAVKRLMSNIEAGVYTPRKFIDQNYGDAIQGPRLKRWVEENFADRVKLPPGTKMLLPAGA